MASRRPFCVPTVLCGLALATGVAGCASNTVAGDTASTTQALSANPRRTRYRNRPYNWSGQGHGDTCIRLQTGSADIRYPDGAPTGLVLTNDMLAMVDPAAPPCTGTNAAGYPTPAGCNNVPPGEHLERVTDGAVACLPGYARLDAREVIHSAAGGLVFARGGWGFVGGDAASAARFGHVLASDLASDVRTTQSPAMARAQGNGSPCNLGQRRWHVHVRSVPQDMGYMNSAGTARATSYTIYGDSGADLGTADERAAAHHFTLLNWSWVNVSGGGVARALLHDGDGFRRCRGVPSIAMATLAPDGHTVNGRVRAVYGAVGANGGHVYGWTIASHRFASDAHSERHLR